MVAGGFVLEARACLPGGGTVREGKRLRRVGAVWQLGMGKSSHSGELLPGSLQCQVLDGTRSRTSWTAADFVHTSSSQALEEGPVAGGHFPLPQLLKNIAPSTQKLLDIMHRLLLTPQNKEASQLEQPSGTPVLVS